MLRDRDLHRISGNELKEGEIGRSCFEAYAVGPE